MTQNRQLALIAVLLAAASLAVYWPIAHHPFLNLDDNQYVSDNEHVQEGLTWTTVAWAFTSYDALNWHPLTWLSHAADVQMFGLEPGPHHAVNLVLHALNVVLLFLVLQRATGCVGRSAMVAALFALHPINVESVAWLAERKNLLSMLFFLLALGSYPRYVRRPLLSRYAVVALWFALGLMAKPQIITLPFVLLLWDYWPLKRVALRRNEAPDTSGEEPRAKTEWRLLALEKAPLLLLCAVSSYLTMQAQQAGGAVASFTKYSLSVRLENALVSYAGYLGKAFWPANLALMYPHPGDSLRLWQIAGSLLLLLAITATVLRHRERRYLRVGWFWFLGTLVPMIGLVQVGHQAMADRYAYLPFIGLFIMLSWGVADLIGWVALRRENWSPAPRLLYPVSVVVLLPLAFVTHRQVWYWGDNLRLWAHVNDVIGPNLISEERTGDELLKRKQPARAMEHYRRAVEIKASDADSNFALGVFAQKQGNLSEAIQRYQVVVANAANASMRARALTYMSYAYRDLGDAERAQALQQAAGKLRE